MLSASAVRILSGMEPMKSWRVWKTCDVKKDTGAPSSQMICPPSTIRRMFPLEKALKNQIAGDASFAKASAAMAAAVKTDVSETGLSGLLMGLLQRSFAMVNERRML